MARLIPYRKGDPDPNPGVDTLEVEYGGDIIVFEYKDWWPGPESVGQTPTQWIVEIDLADGTIDHVYFDLRDPLVSCMA